jgi:hypothetical protein
VNFTAVCLHRFRWLNLPGAFLVMLLQRTPVLRLAAVAEEQLVASPIGTVLRSAAAIAASLGAMHSLAGATTMYVQQNSTIFVKFGDPPRLDSPIPLTAGTPIAPILIYVNGGPSPAGSFEIKNLPPGLTAAGANSSGLVNSSSVVINGTPTTSGTFNASVLAWEFAGGPATQGIGSRFPDTGPLTLAFNVAGTANVAPKITAQPVGQVVALGASATLSVVASGVPPPTYQWQRNGSPIAGATNATLTLTNVQAGDAGDYRVTATNAAGSEVSSSATLSVLGGTSSAQLSNLSVRTTMAAGQELIVGVVVNGGSRNILVRAVGPTLATFGLTGVMADPHLDLFNGSAVVLSNEDWPASLAPTFASVGAFPLSNGSKDAAFMQAIDGPRSIQARGTGAGTVLVEAYDTGAPGAAHLINVSARNRVGTGSDILIAGFTVAGSGAKNLLIRAIGPRLTNFGVSGVLADPKLEVYNSGASLVAQNDNWDESLAPRFEEVGAFGLSPGSRDAALLTSLTPGGYTVQVSGVNGGTGEALVEIYEVP